MLLETIGWRDGALVGHDIGSRIAQLVAVERPALLDRLVLLTIPSPSDRWLKEPVWDAILGAQDFDLKKGLRKSFETGMANTDRVTPELIAMYEAPFAAGQGRLS
jgi:pimeloyl-ACP methyl ester carboxylesterase